MPLWLLNTSATRLRSSHHPHCCSKCIYAHITSHTPSTTTMSVRGKGQLPRRSFGGPTDESALDVNDNLSPNEAASPRTLGGAERVSFGTMNHRPSFLARWRRGGQDEESAGATPRSPMPERPPIPSMIQPANEPESTPLPKLSMIVFCIVRFVSRRVLPAMSYDPIVDHARRIPLRERLYSIPIIHGGRCVYKFSSSCPCAHGA